METKFTKGEWTVGIKTQTVGILSPTLVIADCEIDKDIPKEEQIANKKLIAAAPDLFNALLEVAEMAWSCNQIEISDDQFKRIEQAIKKATE